MTGMWWRSDAKGYTNGVWNSIVLNAHATAKIGGFQELSTVGLDKQYQTPKVNEVSVGMRAFKKKMQEYIYLVPLNSWQSHQSGVYVVGGQLQAFNSKPKLE